MQTMPCSAIFCGYDKCAVAGFLYGTERVVRLKIRSMKWLACWLVMCSAGTSSGNNQPGQYDDGSAEAALVNKIEVE
jgi:hypothetical protein